MLLSTREIIECLVDKNSLTELYKDPQGGDEGVFTGIGFMNGKKIYLIADVPSPLPKDFHLLLSKKVQLIRLVQQNPHPLVVIFDRNVKQTSASRTMTMPPKLVKAVLGENGFGTYFLELSKLSGLVPVVGLVAGDVIAGHTFAVGLCDVIAITQGSNMSLVGVEAVEKLTGKKVSLEDHSAAEMHCSVSGTGDFLAKSGVEAVDWIKKYLSYFTHHEYALAESEVFSTIQTHSESQSLALIESKRAFDLRQVLGDLVDPGSFFELKELYANEVVTGLARIKAMPIGIIGNNSLNKFGAIYPDSCQKIAKFINLCNAYAVPLLFLADTPGFMVDKDLEKAGAIKYGSLVLSALANSTVTKISVVTRKAFGGGLFVMAVSGFADYVFVLPKAVTGPFAGSVLRDPSTPEEREGVNEAQDFANMQRLVDLGHFTAIVEWMELRAVLTEVFGNTKKSKTASAGRNA